MSRPFSIFFSLASLGLLVAGAPACSSADGDESADEAALTDLKHAKAILEIHLLDIWAQPLPEAGTSLSVTRGNGRPTTLKPQPIVQIALSASGSYKIHLSAVDHDAADLSFTFDGTRVSLEGDSAGSDTPAVSLSHRRRSGSGVNGEVHSAYIGLRHQWFSSEGRPARRGNEIDFLMDGSQAWGSVNKDLHAAKKEIRISTWWWESDFELVRSGNTAETTDQRWANTIMGTLEGSRATKRVLVGQFLGQDGILQNMSTDAKLRAHAAAPNDDFEFMGQANLTKGKFHFKATPVSFSDRVRAGLPEGASPDLEDLGTIASTMPERDVDLTQWPVSVATETASYHQKFMSIDSDLAYIGGMNLRRVDWDESNHAVFNAKRMKFDATQAARDDVAATNAMPDMGPRKDYMVRLHGPAAQDVAEVFHERWDYQIDQKVDFAEKSSRFDVDHDIEAIPGGKQVQVTTTLPLPFWEHSIGETWFNAVRHAKNYIYIEDQYFRVPMLNEAIAARMKEVPALKLIVVTMPVNEWTDPGCGPTAKANESFQSQFPDRYLLLKFVAFDTSTRLGIDETKGNFVDIDTHSKMLLVDDKFMSVGSANKNDRGILYEGEMNIAVLDAEWVKSARHRIFANVLPAGTPESDDVEVLWTQLKDASAYNGSVFAAWDKEGGDLNLNGAELSPSYLPRGLVYPLVIRPLSYCLVESVGPDMVDAPPQARGGN